MLFLARRLPTSDRRWCTSDDAGTLRQHFVSATVTRASAVEGARDDPLEYDRQRRRIGAGGAYGYGQLLGQTVRESSKH